MVWKNAPEFIEKPREFIVFFGNLSKFTRPWLRAHAGSFPRILRRRFSCGVLARRGVESLLWAASSEE